MFRCVLMIMTSDIKTYEKIPKSVEDAARSFCRCCIPRA